jgi:hypothetical protein
MTHKSPILLPNKYSADSLRATYNHVWSISHSDRMNLGVYCLVKTTVGELLEKIDTSHSFIDFLTYPWRNGKLTLRVNYVNGSTSYLEELSETGRKSDIVLVSIRMVRVEYLSVKDSISNRVMERTSVALVLINPEHIDVDKLKCYKLDGTEWKE